MKMSEPAKKIPAPLPTVGGGNAATPDSGKISEASKLLVSGTGGNPPAAKSPIVPIAPGSSVALFGGHKGGGKKRRDGLVAGSPEAIAADKAADAKRKRDARAEKKAAEVPAALPSRVASAENPAAALVFDSPAMPDTVDVVPPVAAPLGLPPTFVPWHTRLLEKPAKLLAKILDRTRGFYRAKQVRKLALTPSREKKILDALKWSDDLKADFVTAASDCAVIELNRRQVPGAEHGHWITLVMCCGEMINHELQTSSLIESLVLEDRAEKTGEKK
jgi:hypothetical protein